jgi:hypothetical protein
VITGEALMVATCPTVPPKPGRLPSYAFHCHDDDCEDCFGQ